MGLDARVVDAVLGKLGVAAPAAPDLSGLERVYGAWCQRVPFDNARKLVHLHGEAGGPLPGSTAEDFLRAWLELGAGGTCWAGNGALHDVLAALGFIVERVAATMMAAPDTPPSNHGSVLVHVGGERYLADASILSQRPLRLLHAGQAPAGELPRVEPLGSGWAVRWRILRAPEGFPCRIDRIGIGADEWDAFHQRTRAWGPFNYAVSARVGRGPYTIGFGLGQRYRFEGAALTTEACDRAGRDRFLIDELGIDAALVARLPEDRDLPPPPPR
jgi:N-hydroxyarylamine O-acetyltransferase